MRLQKCEKTLLFILYFIKVVVDEFGFPCGFASKENPLWFRSCTNIACARVRACVRAPACVHIRPRTHARSVCIAQTISATLRLVLHTTYVADCMRKKIECTSGTPGVTCDGYVESRLFCLPSPSNSFYDGHFKFVQRFVSRVGLAVLRDASEYDECSRREFLRGY